MSKEQGYINAFNDFKGFGFIRREKGKDVFFSIDDFEDGFDIDSVLVGMRLNFSIIDTSKGPRATSIKIK